MRISLRFKILLAVLFALTVLACFDVRSPSSEVVKAVDSTSRPKGSAATDSKQSTKSVMILALQSRSRSDEQKEINAFLQRDWTPPPPPPPPAPPPPPPPQAPPLPFSFIGKILEGKQWTVFLAQQERTHAVTAGDLIGHEYKVESITPPLMTFTYLPLKQTQSLSIGLAE